MDYQVGDVVEWREYEGASSVLVLVKEPEPDYALPILYRDMPGLIPDPLPLVFRGEIIGSVDESILGRPVVPFFNENLDEKIVRVLGPEEAATVKAAYAVPSPAVQAMQAVRKAVIAANEEAASRATLEATADRESKILRPTAGMYRAGPLGYVHIADVVAAGQLMAVCGRDYRWSEPLVRPTPETRFCHTCERVARRRGYELPEGWGH